MDWGSYCILSSGEVALSLEFCIQFQFNEDRIFISAGKYLRVIISIAPLDKSKPTTGLLFGKTIS